jgi:hypothetical protein
MIWVPSLFGSGLIDVIRYKQSMRKYLEGGAVRNLALFISPTGAQFGPVPCGLSDSLLE